MKIRTKARLRLAKRKFGRKIRYISGIFIFILIIFLFSHPSKTKQHVAKQKVVYKTSSIADLDIARARAVAKGHTLPVIDLTKRPPTILQEKK